MNMNLDKIFPNKYTKDKHGKDILVGYDNYLKKYCHQIMMEWEIEYMKKCIRKLNPFGDILEVGFGMGYSASEIQKYDIKSHTIIECDPISYQKAVEWSKNQKNKTNIVFGKWEDVYKNLGKFDCFFYDPYNIDGIKNFSSMCSNIIFSRETLKYNSRDCANISFYCVGDDNYALSFQCKIKTLNPNYNYNCEFDIYHGNVPNNCYYVDKKDNLYLPLIIAKKIKILSYQ